MTYLTNNTLAIVVSGLSLAALTWAAFSFTVTSATDGNSDEETRIETYVTSLQGDDYLTYTHPEHGFSFDLSKDFIVSNFEEDGKEIIVAEHPTLKMGFQMVISPFDEKGPITKERILEGLPALVMENVVDFFIASETPAIRFSSKNAQLGDTRELWFVHEGHLYQIQMYAAHKEWLDAWIRQLASGFFSVEPTGADDTSGL